MDNNVPPSSGSQINGLEDVGKILAQLLNKNIEQSKQNDETLEIIKDTQRSMKDTQNMVNVGFIALIVIVAGTIATLAFAYIQQSITDYHSLVDKLNGAVQSSKVIIVTPTPTPSIIPTPTQ